MRVLPIAACLATFAVTAWSGSASSAERSLHRAAPSGHLYVAAYGGSQPEILRFPFVNGFPANAPDLVYANVEPPMAVGHDGTLYATVPLGCCQGLGTIDVFPPNSNAVGRQITLPNLHEDTTIDTALVEGPGAYLYVGYAAFISGLHTPGRRAPKQGVAVYPPGANGGGRPLRMFDVPIDIAGPDSLAFDHQGQLYVATESSDDLHNRIYTVQMPLSAPRIVSALDLSSSYNVWGMEFSDGGRNLYALQLGSAQGDEIAVYPYGASGNTPPSRFIKVGQTSEIIAVGLGIAGANAYVGVYRPTSVLAYDKHASGSPPPVFTLTPSNIISLEAIAIGP